MYVLTGFGMAKGSVISLNVLKVLIFLADACMAVTAGLRDVLSWALDHKKNVTGGQLKRRDSEEPNESQDSRAGSE